jgi:hypothetical protein
VSEHEWLLWSGVPRPAGGRGNVTIWIHGGENNTIFLHNYGNYHKKINTISDIYGEDGCKKLSFKEIAEAGKEYFSNILKVPVSFPIREILQVIQLFPKEFNMEHDLSLVEEITQQKNSRLCPLFKKEKSQVWTN